MRQDSVESVCFTLPSSTEENILTTMSDKVLISTVPLPYLVDLNAQVDFWANKPNRRMDITLRASKKALCHDRCKTAKIH